MITGEVTPEREAIVNVRVAGPGGVQVELRAVLDTGFNGYLTLPGALIAELDLPPRGSVPVVLGDGSTITAYIYKAFALWDDRRVPIAVQESEGDALLGMSLLFGSLVTLEVTDGGSVSVEPLE